MAFQTVTPIAVKGGCGATGCGASDGRTGALPDHVRRKVEDHPCYSERAHHHFARMHLAVAPACNIQCHYCNRKYDCSNESRPGVVSELLKPGQAARKALAVAAAIPQTSVVGIAGPGDPLANPARTFATFRAIAEKAPDLKLCVSTNGLALPDHVDELARLGVDHVTITINCIDPDVGAKIYPWILWKRKRVFGREASEILVARQLRGLEMLAARGILAKVNSVMIPGINDRHLVEVSKAVKARGAFLHNVMPLIADPAHGTYYGLAGRRGPTPAELKALQDECEGDMAMMRHCRQCRADAVGMLGEDRGAEFTMDRIDAMEIDHAAAMARRAAFRADVGQQARAPAPQPVALHLPARRDAGRPVLMAVATRGQGLVNEHFGHAREFLVYEATAAGARLVGVRKTELFCGGQETCGDDEDLLARNLRALEGCEAVLCARIGLEPWRELEAAGIRPDSAHAMEPIEEAVMALWRAMRPMEQREIAAA
ncbi:MAG: nitrogenase cofactor biosynthesis protein NifB [Candidatus Nitricoxidivorans perseverans]|uniref:FeMo cofactor biosynthesis protein NifB n=1 Tax=Candidatus Nitricoxidivorans perseverans TaxID=2975601 RepID=A0AA49FL77_9PROT|nr:MAG: nitrogenase cofactor biosynthesis protein NifB [Candidatus Nitricoxidivorans perseverans]